MASLRSARSGCGVGGPFRGPKRRLSSQLTNPTYGFDKTFRVIWTLLGGSEDEGLVTPGRCKHSTDKPEEQISSLCLRLTPTLIVFKGPAARDHPPSWVRDGSQPAGFPTCLHAELDHTAQRWDLRRGSTNCNISRGFGLLISVYAAQNWSRSRPIKHWSWRSELHSQSRDFLKA